MSVKHSTRSETLARLLQSVRIDEATGCWCWTSCTSDSGYGKIRINGKQMMAHRVMYELEVGPIPDAMCVLHRCDNPPCCNPDHLFLGTKGDNNRDCRAKGRNARGKRHGAHTRREAFVAANRRRAVERPETLRGKAKLTPEQIAAIKELDGTISQREIGRRFGVTHSAIQYVLSKSEQ